MRHARKAPGQRPLRVGEEIRHLLSKVLGLGNFRDPDLSGNTITVTEVRMSPDLKHAKVFVMPLGGRNREQVLAALARAEDMFRAIIARDLKLRYLPHLSFALDETFDEASHIDTLLRRPEVARDLARHETAETDDTEE